MNQEELDSLVGDEFDEIIEDDLDGKSEEIDEDIVADDDELIEDDALIDDAIEDEEMEEEFDDSFADVLGDSEEEVSGESDTEETYPPPADSKNRVVAQLDEVTKESEEKATQILDIMDEISENVESNIESIKGILEFLNKQKDLFEKLHNKFPHIKTFEVELGEIEKTIDKVNDIIQRNEATSDKIFTVMDIMQYQDIHRQKIERVINIMRALIKYMNKLFEGNVEDEKRVQSAKHIHGDTGNEVLSDDDIEALLDQFGV